MLRLGFVMGLVITLVLIGGCAPAETTEEGGTNLLSLLIFVILIFGGMYFLLIRPQRRRMKEQKKIVEELRRGDKVITAGGIYGVVERVSEETVDLKVESGTIIRFVRAAIHVKQAE
jgi:preprotein translocase subunit YajC